MAGIHLANRERCVVAAIAVSLISLGCGGGGAAADAGATTGPGDGSSPPTTTPATPSGTVVTAAGASFTPATTTIAQGSSVTWQISGNTHNVTFGNNKPAEGNIGNTAAGGSATRSFPTPGTYPYECTLHSGMAGTVVVQGTAALVFTSVAVTPATPAISVGATSQLSASARDQNGSAIAGMPAAGWTSSNTAVATVSASGLVTGVSAGTAVVTASVASGATTKSGTATVTVTAASATNTTVTTPNETFSPRVVNIAAGSTVTWQFSGARHNVTFGSLKPTGGDIPDIDAGNAVARTFPGAGTYDYQCTRHSGMTGQVIVGGGGAVAPPAVPPSNPGSIVQATPGAFTPERLEITPGGTVTWEFSGGTFGIVFEDEAPPGGNIPDAAPGTRVSRTFPNAGDYDYYSSKNRDVKGRIRVR